MKILGIESSCDESALAVFDSEKGVEHSLVHSQIDLHALYGGVVPDLASSEHLKKLPALVEALAKRYDLAQIDLVAATSGPGLPNCLAMGASCAGALAAVLGKPLAGVNHLCGHAYSPFIETHAKAPADFGAEFQKLLPHLGLAVSGGNTILFEITPEREIIKLAETVDDAAGEALDKGAKLLGMPYPGAPLIEKLAMRGAVDKRLFPCGQNRKIEDDPDFSFSGLKTSLRYYLEKLGADKIEAALPDICASYQFAVIEQLRRRADFFARRKKYASIAVSGGVSNNASFVGAFEALAHARGAMFLAAPKQYRGDNAAMVAFAAFARPEALRQARGGALKIDPAWELA